MRKVLFLVLMLASVSADAMDWQYGAYSDPMTDAKKEVAGSVNNGVSIVFSCWSGQLAMMLNTGEFVGDSRMNGPSDGEIYYSYRIGQEQAVMRKTAKLSSDNKTLVLVGGESSRIALGLFRSSVMFQLADFRGQMIRLVVENGDAETALRKLSCADRYFPPKIVQEQKEGSGAI